MRSETIAIHSGYDVEPTTKAVAVPIYQTVAYAFDSADHGAALFNLEIDGYRYSRIANPTNDVLERRVGALEAMIDTDTRAVFCETVGNPAGNICDIEAIAAVAHAHGVPLIVDNTVPTPILLRPIEFGADIVVESLTKFMGGHGTTLGGIIVDSGRFPWAEHGRRFAMMNEPEKSYHGLIFTERYGPAAYIARCRAVSLRNTGSILAPLNAFLLLQGIETVALRIERHVENADKVARFLRDDRRVGWVNYAGFHDSPHHALT